jgi:3-hydroxymyristoyl/3-hydroxydecanoyl-(acyl carrier protein) dehydratase
MPFAVLLEIALQPCGWLAAYVGSALQSETDLSFRNLGGKATQHQRVTRDSGLLTIRTKLTDVANSGGMIIQHYEFAVTDTDGQLVYDGTTYFGFFSKAALAQQVGLRDTKPFEPWNETHTSFALRDFAPDARWQMIDAVSIDSLRVEGTKAVDPQEWFFQAHFYQDPVMPGSLGLEAFLQLLQSFAEQRWGTPKNDQWDSPGIGQNHEWIYRGQVVPKDRKMTVQAEITKIDDARRLIQANGILFVDGRPIYRMTDFSLQGWD